MKPNPATIQSLLGRLILSLWLGLAPLTHSHGEDVPDFSAGLPPAPQTEPNEAPPAPDRADQAGGANAGAIVGAAIAGAMCAMLMAQAAKEQDPEKKQQLMMQAAMQCAQSAASAAAAGGNEEAQQAVNQQQADPLPPLPSLAQEKKSNDSTNPEIPSSSAQETEDFLEPTTDPFQLADADNFVGVGTDAFNQGGGDLPFGQGVDDGIRTLNPIDDATVNFDDNSKGGGTTPDVPLGSSSTSFTGQRLGTGGDSASLNLAQGRGVEEAHQKKRRKSRDVASDEAGGDSSVSLSSGSSSGGFDYNGALSKLMGNKGADGGSGISGGGGSIQIARVTPENGKKSTPNIFEYASFRYRQHKKDGLLTTNRTNKSKKDKPLSAERMKDQGARLAKKP